MKILVTGAAGFIGSHLTLALLEQGHELVCVDNLNDYYDPKLKEARLGLFKDKVVFYKTDIADTAAMEKIFQTHQFDKVCHLAGQAGILYSMENPFAYATSNYMGTQNILEFSKRNNVPHVVVASSSSVYGLNDTLPFNENARVDSPVSIYAASKRGTELLSYTYHHLFDLNVTCLRFFTVYGPYQRPDMALMKFTKAILNGETIELRNNGQMKRDYTYVGDIIDGCLKAMDKPEGFQIFNLGAGNPISLMAFIALLEQYLGKKANIKLVPDSSGEVRETFADISKARAMLGYEPKTKFADGVKAFVAWYQQYYADQGVHA